MGSIFDLVGKIVEKTTELVVNAPTLPVKIAEGIGKGAKKGYEELKETIKELFERL